MLTTRAVPSLGSRPPPQLDSTRFATQTVVKKGFCCPVLPVTSTKAVLLGPWQARKPRVKRVKASPRQGPVQPPRNLTKKRGPTAFSRRKAGRRRQKCPSYNLMIQLPVVSQRRRQATTARPAQEMRAAALWRRNLPCGLPSKIFWTRRNEPVPLYGV
ncbi:unnamed protein product [Amoebophrya sp. A120]|nr:unnamed protein product [Amoebophrya sp. A120]|eukprot:GSA120T00000018001.1